MNRTLTRTKFEVVMGPGLVPAQSPTFEEGPNLRRGPRPDFAIGPENLSVLFSKFIGPSKA